MRRRLCLRWTVRAPATVARRRPAGIHPNRGIGSLPARGPVATYRRSAAGALLAALVLAAGLPGCGKKGPLFPPEAHMPEAVTDLAATRAETVVTLSWRRPARNLDGSSFDDLAAYRLERAVGVGPFRRVAVLDGRDGDLPDSMRWVDTEARAGRRYRYRVFVRNALKVTSRASNPAEIEVAAAPAAPRWLSADAPDGRLTLRWEPVAGAAGYRVYANSSGADAVYGPLTGETLAGTTFATAVDLRKRYWFRLRAVGADGGTGYPSASAAVVPRLSARPGAVGKPEASVAAGRVYVSWAPPAAPDQVGAYRVCREPAFASAPCRLLKKPFLQDLDVSPGITVRYRISVLDRTPEPRESAAVTLDVRLPDPTSKTGSSGRKE